MKKIDKLWIEYSEKFSGNDKRMQKGYISFDLRRKLTLGKSKFRRQRSLQSICHEDAFVKLLKDAPTCRKIVSSLDD